nr:MAG: hypothetical protein DIU80_03585 [Chloroflexota bacterium]
MLSHDDAQQVLSVLTHALQWFGFSTEAARRLAKTIYDHIERDYRKAGMPYGASCEGLLRWFEERKGAPMPPKPQQP